MRSKQLISFAATLLTTLLVGCGNSSESTDECIFGDVPEQYAQLAELKLEMQELNDKYRTTSSDAERNDAAQKLNELAKAERDMERSCKEAAKLLDGKEIDVEVTPESGFVVNGKGQIINRGGETLTISVDTDEKSVPQFLLLSSNGEVVFIGGEGHVNQRVNMVMHFYISKPTQERIDALRLLSRASRLVIVSRSEAENNPVGSKFSGETIKYERNDDEASSDAPEKTSFIVSEQGVGPVVLDADINSLPASVDNLYDSVKKTEEVNEMEDMTVTTLEFMADGVCMLTALAFDDDKIASVEVNSANIPLMIGGTAYYVGSPVDGIKKAKGVSTSDDGNLTYGSITINEQIGDNGNTILSFLVGSAW